MASKLWTFEPIIFQNPCVMIEFTGVLAEPLFDGLTRWDCLQRWKVNREAIESQKPLRHWLTPAQISIARTTWLETTGAQQAIELRAKVDATSAAEEARRPSVRVEIDE